MMLGFPACPVCGGGELYESRYRPLERLLNLFLLRPVRCGACYQRLYKFLWVRALPRRKRDLRDVRHRQANA